MQKKKIKVSIIVPIYNAELNLENCLQSLVKQTYKNIEIILVDDGSSDVSGRICDEYEKKDIRIKVIHKPNGGVSSARNEGLKIATGDFISFVDSDDYIEHNMIKTLLDTALETDSDITICNIKYKNTKGKELFEYTHSNFSFNRDFFPKNMYYIPSIKGYVCNKFYRRRIIYTTNNNFIKFDSSISIGEDDLFNYEIFSKNNNIHISYVDNKLYNYIINETSATQKKFNMKKLSYFDVKEKEIEYLMKEKYKYDFLMADYIINFVRTTLIMNKLNISKNEKYYYLLGKFREYKKNLCYKNLLFNLKIKVLIAVYFPFIYMLKLYIRKEFN